MHHGRKNNRCCTRIIQSGSRLRVFCKLLILQLAMLFAMPPVAAQTTSAIRIPEFSALGMDDMQLADLVPDIRSAPRPQRGPRGERGRWVAPGMVLFGIPFDTTFYTLNGRVARVEKFWAAPRADCAKSGGQFIGEEILDKLQIAYGEGQVSYAAPGSDPAYRSAAWAIDEAQLSLHTEVSSAKCSVRMVLQPRLVKDGSEL